MNTIQQQWDLFKLLIPLDASPVQVEETKTAFYAGAQAILTMQYAMSCREVSDDAGVHMIQGWHEECSDFAKSLSRR